MRLPKYQMTGSQLKPLVLLGIVVLLIIEITIHTYGLPTQYTKTVVFLAFKSLATSTSVNAITVRIAAQTAASRLLPLQDTLKKASIYLLKSVGFALQYRP